MFSEVLDDTGEGDAHLFVLAEKREGEVRVEPRLRDDGGSIRRACRGGVYENAGTARGAIQNGDLQKMNIVWNATIERRTMSTRNLIYWSLIALLHPLAVPRA